MKKPIALLCAATFLLLASCGKQTDTRETGIVSQTEVAQYNSEEIAQTGNVNDTGSDAGIETEESKEEPLEEPADDSAETQAKEPVELTDTTGSTASEVSDEAENALPSLPAEAAEPAETSESDESSNQIEEQKPYEEPKPVDAPTSAEKAILDIALECIDGPLSSLTDQVGEPLSASYEASCSGPGDDGILQYDGITVYTYREPNGTNEVIVDAE